MLAKIIGGLALVAALALGGVGVTRFVGGHSCCSSDSACCNPTSACCPAEQTATEDCCAAEKVCCETGEACCTTEK